MAGSEAIGSRDVVLELDATDELACERDQDQREIAGSEGVAMVPLAVDHPPLRVQNDLARSRSPSARLKMK